MDVPFKTDADCSDEVLLVAYGRGEVSAARILSGRHSPRILAYAARLLGGDISEAEDVAQEAMLRLWKIAPDWRDGEAKVTTWLYRVVTNLCTDRLRKHRPVALDAIAEPADDNPAAERRLQDGARMNALVAALGGLPERQRQAVVLRHIEGLTNPEIATIMEISTEAVESLTARGKRALAAALAGQREELGYQDD